MQAVYNSPFFGIALSVLAFALGIQLQKRTKLAILNPLITATVIVAGVLLLLRIPYTAYDKGGSIIQLMLVPATACLAVSIYTRIRLLKANFIPIIVGCAAGSLTSMASVYGLCRLLHLDEAITRSLLPKSVTTPIALSIAAQHGGIAPITVTAVIISGITGSILAPWLIRILRLNDSISTGIAMGSSAHAVGTAKALEMGETEGAMSGLAIGICGLFTVIFSLIISQIPVYTA